MTDNEIMKALECCVNSDCLNCPIWSGEWYNGTWNDFLQNVIDLIKQLQAEKRKLEMILEAINNDINPLPFEIDFDKAIRIAKSEAIKEFAERLKEDISWHRTEMYMNGLKGTPRTNEITYGTVEEYIETIKTEMVGDK